MSHIAASVSLSGRIYKRTLWTKLTKTLSRRAWDPFPQFLSVTELIYCLYIYCVYRACYRLYCNINYQVSLLLSFDFSTTVQYLQVQLFTAHCYIIVQLFFVRIAELLVQGYVCNPMFKYRYNTCMECDTSKFACILTVLLQTGVYVMQYI